MDVKTYNEHLTAMDRISSMDHLKALRESIYPHLKDEAQSKYHRDIHKRAFPEEKVYSFDDIEKIFGGLGG